MSPEMQANVPQSATGQVDLPVLRNGVRGRAVILLQQLLNAQSYRTGGVDGVFGAVTEQAVRTYQKNFGLVQDGIVGAQTWNKIGDRFINP